MGGRYFFERVSKSWPCRRSGWGLTHSHREEGKERSECVLHQLPIHTEWPSNSNPWRPLRKRSQRKVSQTIWCKKSQGEASHLDGRLDWGVGERELCNLVRGVFFTKLLLPQTPGKNKCPNPKRPNNDGVSINAEPTHCHCACMFSKHYSYFSF